MLDTLPLLIERTARPIFNLDIMFEYGVNFSVNFRSGWTIRSGLTKLFKKDETAVFSSRRKHECFYHFCFVFISKQRETAVSSVIGRRAHPPKYSLVSLTGLVLVVSCSCLRLALVLFWSCCLALTTCLGNDKSTEVLHSLVLSSSVVPCGAVPCLLLPCPSLPCLYCCVVVFFLFSDSI
jgi:hypothetical protein